MNSEKYKPTYILIALNVAIYIIGAIVGGNPLETSGTVVWDWGKLTLECSLMVLIGSYSHRCSFMLQYST